MSELTSNNKLLDLDCPAPYECPHPSLNTIKHYIVHADGDLVYTLKVLHIGVHFDQVPTNGDFGSYPQCTTTYYPSPITRKPRVTLPPRGHTLTAEIELY